LRGELKGGGPADRPDRQTTFAQKIFSTHRISYMYQRIHP
jgi:hypothetical protein